MIARRRTSCGDNVRIGPGLDTSSKRENSRLQGAVWNESHSFNAFDAGKGCVRRNKHSTNKNISELSWLGRSGQSLSGSTIWLSREVIKSEIRHKTCVAVSRSWRRYFCQIESTIYFNGGLRQLALNSTYSKWIQRLSGRQHPPET